MKIVFHWQMVEINTIGAFFLKIFKVKMNSSLSLSLQQIIPRTKQISFGKHFEQRIQFGALSAWKCVT